MKLIQCQKGHYYDSSKFESCPYCESVQKEIGVTVPLNRSMETPGTKNGPVQASPVTEQEATPKAGPVAGSAAGQVTGPASGSVVGSKAGPASGSVAGQEESPAADFVAGQPQPSVSEQWRAPQPAVGRQEFWQVPEDDNRTVSYYSKKIGIEPVVGWLVAVSGDYLGESFKLKSGRNFIGRSPEMDIQLSMDLSVSRRKHAVLIYEPRSRQFIAQPGESRELFYLNDEVVLNNVTMKAYDVLTIGETKLLLMPLCGEKFSWDELKK